MTEAVRSPWSPLSLSLEALFDFLEGTEEETRTSSLVNPSTDHPFAEEGGGSYSPRRYRFQLP